MQNADGSIKAIELFDLWFGARGFQVSSMTDDQVSRLAAQACCLHSRSEIGGRPGPSVCRSPKVRFRQSRHLSGSRLQGSSGRFPQGKLQPKWRNDAAKILCGSGDGRPAGE